MKISKMLKRENFWEINRATVEEFYRDNPENRLTRLYVYPRLNAVVCRCPSAAVKRFLYTEYRVQGSLPKKAAAFLYVRLLLNTGGLFAAKRPKLHTAADADTLIYPCNRKYRFFDFAAGTVTVVPKVGFPTECLCAEIAFRTTHTAAFLRPILRHGDTFYTEEIIDGVPLARLPDSAAFKAEAAAQWREFVAPTVQAVPAKCYVETLRRQIQDLLLRPSVRQKPLDFSAVRALTDRLCRNAAAKGGTVPVGLSHGDLQPGNIWVENKTGRVIIIDWETADCRSLWYDDAVLAGAFRSGKNFFVTDPVQGATLLLEEWIYCLRELSDLPDGFGAAAFNEKAMRIGKAAEAYDV